MTPTITHHRLQAEWLAVHLASCDRHPPRYGQPTLPEEEQHA